MFHRLWRIALWIIGALVALVVLITVAAAIYDVASTGVTATVPPLDAHGHDVRTGDVITRYEEWGTRGPPLLLIPGFVESSFVWRQVGPLLGQRFRVYAPDVRGFGYTTHRGPYTLRADTSQMVRFIRALHLDPAHGPAPVVVGHSSGAAIAANLALRHPRIVRGIVMLDGDGTPLGTGPAWLRHLMIDPYFTAVYRLALKHPVLLKGIWASVCGPDCPPFTGTVLEGWTRPLEVPGAADALKAIVQAPLIGLPPPQIRRIRVPAAVMLGKGDPTIRLKRARTTARWLHTHRVVVVPGARHLPMVSRPNLFVSDLTRLVGKLRVPSAT